MVGGCDKRGGGGGGWGSNAEAEMVCGVSVSTFSGEASYHVPTPSPHAPPNRSVGMGPVSAPPKKTRISDREITCVLGMN